MQFCVVDIETTGLRPDDDRVVELAVLRCDAAGRVMDEWHTLIDPERAVDAEWVHGVSDAMVAGAPRFSDVADLLLISLHNAVLVGHNAAFDHRFIESELARAGRAAQLPYLCTMHLRRRVGLPAPVMHRLDWACWHNATPIGRAHAAISDARATAALLGSYLSQGRRRGHLTVGDLGGTAAQAGSCNGPLLRLNAPGQPPRGHCRPRVGVHVSAPIRSRSFNAADEYRQVLRAAVADLKIDGDEVADLHRTVLDLGLTAEDVVMVHRDFIATRLEEYLADDELSWEEYEQLRILTRLLAVDTAWLADLIKDVRPANPNAIRFTPDDDKPSDGPPDETVLKAPISVCFTGPFEAMPLTRSEVETLAADAGMLVRSGVSRVLDVLVCADPDSGTGKLCKAEARGTVIIDQETFLAIAGAATPTPSPTGAVLSLIAQRRRRLVVARKQRDTGAVAAPALSHALRVEVLAGPKADRVLWCEAGAHEWSRPSQRGRLPKQCPEHAMK
ncbi:MAG: exonuclease domain-containing protein [Actinomycetota bacterium]|nr:exonuclease domain-containing protein [Actinomycetota bacterium]